MVACGWILFLHFLLGFICDLMIWWELSYSDYSPNIKELVEDVVKDTNLSRSGVLLIIYAFGYIFGFIIILWELMLKIMKKI